MNVDLRKQEMLIELKQLEEECKLLLERIETYRVDLSKVETEEDAKTFDVTHDLEDGLDIIRLF